MKIWDKGTSTRLPEDPILLKEYMEKLPPEVIEQFVANWRREGEVLEEGENVDIVVKKLLSSMREGKNGRKEEIKTDRQKHEK